MRFRALKSKKLFVVFKNLIIVEVFAYVIFMALALSGDWGKTYESFTLSRHVPFEVVEFLFLGLSQLGIIILVFTKLSVEESNINEIIKSGENEKVEFKTSLRWDIKRNLVNKELEKTIMKAMTAFLNSEGGNLLIGVDDEGKPVGLENDFASLPKPDTDGFENHFNSLFNNMIGPEFRRLVKLTFNNVGDKTVCLASIEPSHRPVYLKTGDGENFYIRTGNVATPLKMSEVATYVSSWRRRLK